MKTKMIYISMILTMLIGCSPAMEQANKETEQAKGSEQVNNSQQKNISDGDIPEKLPAYWPTKEWKSSLPEQQGMNSGKLADLFDALGSYSSLNGLIIIRNGYIVTEKYAEDYGYGPEESHEINSVTKSIMSAVTGVAVHEGYINSVNDRILDYFPDRHIENLDEHKKNLTVEDFLTMKAGLDWPELDKERYIQFWREFEGTNNTIQYVLNKPTDPELIGKFHYNTGLAHVLSAIVQDKTGKKTSEYAQEKIFDPIGITSAYWPEAQGVSKGGYRMEMTPRDMARFGYLYLNNGNWEGKQIIPEEWVKTSMSELVPTGRKGGDQYGYYFWQTTTKAGYKEISAMGDRGQYIIMVPELDLMVIQTSRDWLDINIYEDYIYPAVESADPIPVDKEGNARLDAIEGL